MEMNITRATLADVCALARLHIEAEQQTYADVAPGYIANVSRVSGRESIWRLVLSGSSQQGYVLTIKDKQGVMVGFLSATRPGSATEHVLNGIYLLENYQRAGLGSHLLYYYAKELKDAGVQKLCCSIVSECKAARAFFAWTGGIESVNSIFVTSHGMITSIKVTWNNVSQLVRYFALIVSA